MQIVSKSCSCKAFNILDKKSFWLYFTYSINSGRKHISFISIGFMLPSKRKWLTRRPPSYKINLFDVRKVK